MYDKEEKKRLPGKRGFLVFLIRLHIIALTNLCPRLHRRAPQKFVRIHRLLASALHLRETHCAAATGNAESIIKRPPGRPRSFSLGRSQCFYPDAIELEPGARKRRQAPNVVVYVLPRMRPVDLCLAFGNFLRIGHAC